jgi:hypothetical protein
MNKRERLGVILKRLGYHRLERRLYHAEVALVERRERLRIQFLSSVIPIAVWTTLIVYSAAVLARALRQPAPASKPTTSAGRSTNTPASAATP